jgi:hypothetical protein
MAVRSACASSVSRLARRSLALRPAHSRCHQFVTRYPKASAISFPPQLLRLLPAGAVAGWVLHPLESAALPRRTPEADIHNAAFLLPSAVSSSVREKLEPSRDDHFSADRIEAVEVRETAAPSSPPSGTGSRRRARLYEESRIQSVSERTDPQLCDLHHTGFQRDGQHYDSCADATKRL